MNGKNALRSATGFTLIEALIILVVLSVGLLAIAGFQGRMLASGSSLKARAEALNLAEEKLEEFRNNIVISDFTSLTATSNASESIAGNNTTFTREWVIADATGPTRKNITMQVTWTDPKDGALSVVVNSVLAWSDPKASANIDNGTIPGGALIILPSG